MDSESYNLSFEILPNHAAWGILKYLELYNLRCFGNTCKTHYLSCFETFLGKKFSLSIKWPTGVWYAGKIQSVLFGCVYLAGINCRRVVWTSKSRIIFLLFNTKNLPEVNGMEVVQLTCMSFGMQSMLHCHGAGILIVSRVMPLLFSYFCGDCWGW